MEELKGRRLLFTQEYINNGFNGRQAYKKVYETQDDKVADANASRALSSDKVKRYLRAKMKPAEDKAVSQAETFSEIIDTALAELKSRSEGNMPIGEVVSLLEKLSKPIRTRGELRGDIGPAGGVAIQVNFAGGKMDLSKMGLLDLENIKKQIEAEINTKWSNIDALGGFVTKLPKQISQEETTESVIAAVRSLKDI